MQKPIFKQVPGGSAVMICPRTARLEKLRKTVYNAGMGIEDDVSATGIKHTCWFITLTYKEVLAWRAQHIRDYFKRLRSYFYRKNIALRYVWVAELQKRGAVHYHILLWLPKGTRMPKSDTRGWWIHGSTETKPARKRVGYLMKYASKDKFDADHDFPKGCRLYGFGGVSIDVRRRIRWWRAPARVRKYFISQGFSFQQVDLRKMVGGWLDILSGYVVMSIYKLFSFTRSRLVFYCVGDPDVFDIRHVSDFAHSRPF